MTIKDKPALLLVDIQKGFENVAYWGGNRNNPEAEKNVAKLLKFWREKDLPLFHIKHCSTNPDSPLAKGQEGNEIMNLVKPIGDEPVIEKNVNSGFIGTDLKEQLDELGVQTVVIAGLTTDHCVSTTTRMAGNFGYVTYVVADATATFEKTGPKGKTFTAQMIHETALTSLHNEFATVLDTAEVFKKLT